MGAEVIVIALGGNAIKQEESAEIVPAQSLAACGAMPQGQIGWMIQNRVSAYLKKAGLDRSVCTVVTQVVVDDDPDFEDPSKPVGPFYTQEQALELERTKGYRVKEVRPGEKMGWRRVVPSPAPNDILEKDTIKRLILTDVEKVCLNYNKPDEKALEGKTGTHICG